MSKKPFLRNRFNETLPTTNNQLEDQNDTKSKYHRPMPYIHFLALLGLILVVFALVIIIEKQLPIGLRITEESSYPETFIAERAYKILKNLTELGPRPAGSYENDVLAVNLLRTEINSIIKEAKPHHSIELDIQKASGAFSLKFLDGMTNVYRDVQNVVVKISPGANAGNSLLINCHFDSVVDSPGASDDGASCAVMLEILRVLSKSNTIFRHNVIFLFNGGEENFMPASHGFITQHKWAKEVRAFINLEACGAGGREVLFQAGPNHPWILETYSREVPYPCASSLAQEIFQSGVIPGDTDYRIFRDFGNLSGLDFAWSTNGYVYHTKFDTVEQIPLGSLQRTGDNILALIKGVVLGPQLSDVQKYRAGNLVFFDFLGAFVIRWPMLISDFVNISTVILSFYSIWANVKKAAYVDDIRERQYTKKLIGCIFAIIISITLSVLSSVLIAYLLTCLGRTMSWYARPLWVLFLYVIPTLIVSMATILLHARVFNKDLVLSPWAKFQLYYDASQLLWTLILILGIITRVRSSFVALLWALFAAVGNILKSKFYGRWRDSKWLLLHIAVMSLPFVQCFYLLIGAFYLFIPIMGRAGSSSNAEFLIAILVSCTFSSLFLFVVPLVLLVRGAERIFSLLIGLFWISLALLILTPLGFPYSGDVGYLAPQRFMIPHTRRNIRDVSGSIQNRSTGFWIADMDINSPHSVDRHVPQMANAQPMSTNVGDCAKYLYCGLPYLVPVITMISKTHWLPGPEPVILNPVNIEIISRENIEGGERVTLKIQGPSRIGVIISPVLGIHLTGWSLKTEKPLVGPRWNNRETYFIYYAYGLEPVPFVFSVDFKIHKNHKGPIMDLAITSHYLFGPGKTSDTLENFVSQFPQWTSVTHWTATYDSWIL